MKPDRFTEPVTVCYPPNVARLIKLAASQQITTPSEYVRRSVVDRLHADGFTTAPTAGELSDLVDGLRQWALVVGDQIEIFSGARSADKPDDGRNWLPVYYEDSQPFNPALHERHKPVDRVDGERVVRTYPVRPKAQGAG